MPSWLAPAIGTATSFANNLFQRGHERKLYKQQYKDSISFWNMQNEYNSPKAQMQRLKEAGINPVTPFLKGGGMATGNASSSPQVPTQGSTATTIPDATNTLNAIYDLRMKKQGLSKLTEETEGLKTANNRAALEFLYDKLYMAEERQDAYMKRSAETEIKAMEQRIKAQELAAGERSQYGDLGTFKLDERIEKVKNLQQARALIKEQTQSAKMTNKKLKEFEKLMKGLPEGTQHLQSILWILLTSSPGISPIKLQK
jgi:hypothetical protein